MNYEKDVKPVRPYEPGSMLRVREAARILDISERQVARLLDRGELPSVKLGRIRRIPRRAFEDWLNARIADAETTQRQRRAAPHAGINR